MKGKITNFFASVIALLWFAFPLTAYAGAEEEIATQGSTYALEVPKKCEELPPQNEFLHNRILFSWTNKYHPNGYGERLVGLAQREGRIRAEWPGLHALFTAPASLFGWCGWWPKELSLPLKMENQVIMAQSGDDWSVAMSAVAWGPQFAFRWNLDPRIIGASPRSQMAIAFQHTHWSGGSGDLVNNTALQLRQYMLVNNVVFHGNEINAVSVNFAHKFELFPTVTVEYQVGKYLWQVPFPQFLGGLGGLTADPEERTSYRFSGFLELDAAWHITPLFDIRKEGKVEFNSTEHPYMVGFGADMYTSARHFAGISVLYRVYGGMDDNSLNMTRWGVWMPSQDVAYELFVRLPF